MIENIKPMDIEKRSFEIITELLGDKMLDPQIELVIKRAIHTTADFDYADNLVFSENAVSKGIEALDGDSRTFKPCFFALLIIHDFDFEAIALAIAGIHSEKHLCPIAGLDTACTRVNGQNAVVIIIFTAQKHCQLALLKLFGESIQCIFGLSAKLIIIGLPGKLPQGLRVLEIGFQLTHLIDLLLEHIYLLHMLLCCLRIIPEIGRGGDLFKLGNFLFLGL